ncbi:hypothetical protein HY604_04070 [Candidatus Peregrinibacteria bacterium]|nr:hypothetical protein [Candidatus Peregrinibacteria bacterium]
MKMTKKNTIRKRDDSNEAVTKGFFRKELSYYPNRVELHEELSKYVTKVEFNQRMDEMMTMLDGIVYILKEMQREHAFFVARCERMDAKFYDHENRILALENSGNHA